MIDDRLDSTFDKWLREFQKSVKNIPDINDDWMCELACHLCDDIPFGYEASHRLASYIFAYIKRNENMPWPGNELTLQNLLDACKYVGYEPEDVTVFTYDRDSDRKVTVLSNRAKETQLIFDAFPNSIMMTRMSDTSCESMEFQNFMKIADWWENEQKPTSSHSNSE